MDLSPKKIEISDEVKGSIGLGLRDSLKSPELNKIDPNTSESDAIDILATLVLDIDQRAYRANKASEAALAGYKLESIVFQAFVNFWQRGEGGRSFEKIMGEKGVTFNFKNQKFFEKLAKAVEQKKKEMIAMKVAARNDSGLKAKPADPQQRTISPHAASAPTQVIAPAAQGTRSPLETDNRILIDGANFSEADSIKDFKGKIVRFHEKVIVPHLEEINRLLPADKKLVIHELKFVNGDDTAQNFARQYASYLQLHLGCLDELLKNLLPTERGSAGKLISKVTLLMESAESVIVRVSHQIPITPARPRNSTRPPHNTFATAASPNTSRRAPPSGATSNLVFVPKNPFENIDVLEADADELLKRADLEDYDSAEEFKQKLLQFHRNVVVPHIEAVNGGLPNDKKLVTDFNFIEPGNTILSDVYRQATHYRMLLIDFKHLYFPLQGEYDNPPNITKLTSLAEKLYDKLASIMNIERGKNQDTVAGTTSGRNHAATAVAQARPAGTTHHQSQPRPQTRAAATPAAPTAAPNPAPAQPAGPTSPPPPVAPSSGNGSPMRRGNGANPHLWALAGVAALLASVAYLNKKGNDTGPAATPAAAAPNTADAASAPIKPGNVVIKKNSPQAAKPTPATTDPSPTERVAITANNIMEIQAGTGNVRQLDGAIIARELTQAMRNGFDSMSSLERLAMHKLRYPVNSNVEKTDRGLLITRLDIITHIMKLKPGRKVSAVRTSNDLAKWLDENRDEPFVIVWKVDNDIEQVHDIYFREDIEKNLDKIGAALLERWKREGNRKSEDNNHLPAELLKGGKYNQLGKYVAECERDGPTVQCREYIAAINQGKK